MRWRFVDGGPDWDARQAKRVDIANWWSAFADQADALAALFSGRGQFDVAAWMGNTLGAVDERLMWEFGPAIGMNGHRLVITHEHHYELDELVGSIVGEAPQLDGWEFYGHRPQVGLTDAAGLVAARAGGSLDGVTVALSEGSHRLIDLQFFTPSPSGQHDAFVATEALLGEATLNDWVGSVEATKPRRFGRSASRAVPIGELPAAFEQVRRQILARTPTKPYHEWAESAEWVVLQLQPQEAEDYPHTADLAVAVTADVDLWAATHADGRFASRRFSRMGERFVTVKIDGSEGLDGSAFGDRAEIEDALAAALAASGLGGVVGGGTGLRYSYVDLSLTSVDAGLAAAQTCLAAGGVPERSWIIFFDRVWADEWVGVYPTSPPPPA